MASPLARPEEQAQARYFQAGTALHRIFEEAPYLPRCSDNKTAARVRPREYAIRYPYMQINRSGFVSWLIFDLDHNQAMIWDDVDLPPPNIIVRNRKSGHSHLYYAIPPVCTTENARSRPILYMKAVYAAIAVKLQADSDFHSGPVAKTPGHPWWLTHELHNHVYELGELADYVDLPSDRPWGRGAQLDRVSHSRNCMLFELLRHYAYSIVVKEQEHGTFETFTRLLEAYAYNKNNFVEQGLGFCEDLPFSSVKSVVKSVARWTWSRYSGTGRCNRGVMNLDKDLSLPERQNLSAARTHEIRRKATESKIRCACRILQQRGATFTQVAIAKAAGVSRQTVANFKHVLDEVRKIPETVAVLVRPQARKAAQAINALDVKFGVRQVAASLGARFSEAPPGNLELFPAGPGKVPVLDG